MNEADFLQTHFRANNAFAFGSWECAPLPPTVGVPLCHTGKRKRLKDSWKSLAPTSHLAQKRLQSLREGKWGPGRSFPLSSLRWWPEGVPLRFLSTRCPLALVAGWTETPTPVTHGRCGGFSKPTTKSALPCTASQKLAFRE